MFKRKVNVKNYVYKYINFILFTMGTVINKIVFGVIFMFILWKGLDGLIINIFYSSTDYYDILQLEQSNKIESRNLEIANGIVYKKDFFYYEKDQFSPVDVVYPLLSSQQLEKYYNFAPKSKRSTFTTSRSRE